MRKLFFGISAMFLFITGVMPVSGKSPWPEFELSKTTNLEDHFHSFVDDGFGGNWSFKYFASRIFLRRPSNEFDIKFIGSGPNYFNKRLKFDEKSLPLDAGLGVAFYGYLTDLKKNKCSANGFLWVNQETGEIDEVAFVFILDDLDDIKKGGRNRNIILSVPPRCFALYEDILKKTVKFEVPQGIFDPENTIGYAGIDPKDGIYYEFYIKFPAPAEGEPDFLALPAAAE